MRIYGTASRRTRLTAGGAALVCLALLLRAGAVRGEQAFSDEAVERAIAKGVRFLWSRQQKNGSWKTEDVHGRKPWTVGPTAICTYALLESGVKPTDRRMARALRFLEKTQTDATYGLAFRALAYAAALRHDPKYRTLLQQDVRRLVYSCPVGGGHMYTSAARGQKVPKDDRTDQSTSQYGLLGVWAGAMRDLEVPLHYWQISLDYWRKHQKGDGGWSYQTEARHRPSINMTLAGLASVYVCYDNLYAARFVECRGNARFPAAEKAMGWVQKRIGDVYRERDHLYYGLYGVERVGLATGMKFLGRHDWYKSGATHLINHQEGNGSWTKPGGGHSGGAGAMTSYALLFLLRGRRPVLFNRLEFNGDWNNRPRALANLTRWFSRKFEREVHWQIINLKVPVKDWHDAPILCLTGCKEISLAKADLDKIRTFVHQGGSILSVTECGGEGFRKGIREVYRKLFPKYELTKVATDHPIYTVQSRIPTTMEFHEVSNGARPLAIHSDQDLVLPWQTRQYRSSAGAFQAVTNIVAYTNGKIALAGGLRFRGTTLWPPQYTGGTDRLVRIARLKHEGNYDPEPLAYERFARLMGRRTKTKVEVRGPMSIRDLPASDAQLATLTGTGPLSLSETEQKTLKAWLERGGTLVIDAAGGSPQFREAAEVLLTGMFGRRAARRLATTAPLLKRKGFEIGKAHYRSRTRGMLGNTTQPELRAVLLDDRPAVIFSRHDLTAGLVGYSSHAVDGYTPESAYEIMRNIALTASTRQVARPDEALKTRASASRKNEDAALGVDGSRKTRWTTGRPARAGDWFLVDLDRPVTLEGVILDAADSASDYPRGYKVYVSTDGKSWGDAVASGKGSSRLTVITFPKPVRARHVKVVLTAGAGQSHWSIHELMMQFK